MAKSTPDDLKAIQDSLDALNTVDARFVQPLSRLMVLVRGVPAAQQRLTELEAKKAALEGEITALTASVATAKADAEAGIAKAKADHESAVAKLQESHDRHKAELTGQVKELERARDEAYRVAKDAESVTVTAKADAEKTVRTAKKEAEAEVGRAKAAAKLAADDLEKAIQAKRAAHEADEVQRRERLATLDAQIQAKEARAAALDREHQSVVEKLAALIQR